MIVKCSNCQQILAQDDFEAHKCDVPIKDCKTIEVAYFLDESYKDKKRMVGRGIDGVLYTFEVVRRKAIPYILPLSDDWKHRDKSNGKVTEPEIPSTIVRRPNLKKRLLAK